MFVYAMHTKWRENIIWLLTWTESFGIFLSWYEIYKSIFLIIKFYNSISILIFWKLTFASSRFLNKMPDGPVFIVFAFIIRSFDGAGGAAAMTAAVAFLAQCFPDNVGSVMVIKNLDYVSVILHDELLVCELLLRTIPMTQLAKGFYCMMPQCMPFSLKNTNPCFLLAQKWCNVYSQVH